MSDEIADLTNLADFWEASAIEYSKRIAELETVLKKIWKISSNRTGIRLLIDKVLPEGGEEVSDE